jgi:hypothetical protein
MRRTQPRLCQHCGGDFLAPFDNIRQGYGLHCSRRCAQLARAGDPIARFWSHVDKTETCWLWLLSTRGSRGYGEVRMDGYPRRKPSQVAWDLAGGPARQGLSVCHICDVPRCCRNDDWGTYTVDSVDYVRIGHLYLAPAVANARDAAAKGRLRTGDRNPSRAHPERLARGNRSPAHLHPETRQGERNGRAHRTNALILEIRQRYATGETQVAIGADLGIAQATISAIVLRKNWKHI